MGLIRLFLAFVVVVDHLRPEVLKPDHVLVDNYIAYPELGINAGYAVIYFYVISGFLISYSLTHNHDDDLGGIIEFYKSRVVRIFSPYWPLLLIFSLTMGGIAGRSFWAKFIGIFLIGSDWFTCFGDYPNQDFSQFPDKLSQAWSIGAELTFYLFSPVLVRSLAASICVLLLSLACRMSFVFVYGFSNTWTYHFFPSTVMFFILGHLSRLMWDAVRVDRRLGWALLAMSAAVSIRGILTQRWDNLSFYLGLGLFVLSLPAVFELTKNSRVLNSLGDLSYPVYLTHDAAIAVVFFVVPTAGDWLIAGDRWFAARFHTLDGMVIIPAMLLVCVIVAFACRLLIERPATWALRLLLGMKSKRLERGGEGRLSGQFVVLPRENHKNP